MGSILEATIIHHVCIVLVLLWLLNSFKCCHPVVYFLSLIYLYLVHEVYVIRLTRKLQYEERRQSNQRRVLSDSETVRWLNHAIEKIWLVCVEDIISQKILLPIVPWFLQKYKPWTVKDAVVQHLYLGRSPPIFTEMRVLPESNGDDHLVLELGMNFRTADDMSAIIAVKLRKRLGLGMRAKLHLLCMHVEGKVLIGVKFLPYWPFLGRLRVCFAEPPYFQMTVKPIFSHGLDVTELPGIAGWIDNLLALAFEQTLVQPNMLVVDVEKFASPKKENWFSIDAKDPIAHAIVEVLEAADMKPSDLNGLADPYVKGQLGPYRFRTKIQKKNLSPKWYEEFKIPICTWESPNVLIIEVRDKDRLFDDELGDCSVNVNDLKDGQRHDMWLSLENIKMGRLHLAITVSKANTKGAENTCDAEGFDNEHRGNSVIDDAAQRSSSFRSSKMSPKVADEFEPIDFEGQRETGIWIHQPGSEVAQVWEPRKGKSRHLETHHLDGQVQGEGGDSIGSRASTSSSTDESVDAKKPHSINPIRQGLRKLSSVFHRSPRTPRTEEKSKCLIEPEPVSSPQANIKALNNKDIGVKLIIDDTVATPYSAKAPKERESRERSVPDSPREGHAMDMDKGILKHSGKSLKSVLSRKESRKSKTDSGSTPSDNDNASHCDSSDDSSLSSSADVPLGVTGLVIPGSDISSAASCSDNNSLETKDGINQMEALSGSDSFKSKDDIVQTRNEPTITQVNFVASCREDRANPVLLLLWLLNSFNCCHPVSYILSLIYLYQVHELYVMRLRRKVQFEDRRQSKQKRVLSQFETVRWLNYAIEKIWLVCVEEIVSQKILLPIVPWFLQKYKPWMVNDAVVQHLYLGRSPPIFTDMRVLRESDGDDHLVLELGMNFLTADDMRAKLALKVKQRLGLGMRAALHLIGMHVEGKVLIGVKFISKWPFLGRLRVCFAEPPYFQMTVKPIFSHGLDVTELPGIAGWLDNLLALAFEQTLVQPNMLVVDVEKFASPQQENLFSFNAEEPVAYAIVEVLEAADMKPSELNGLADPYVKGQLGSYRFCTKTQKKTLAPKWHEEFEIPINTWESPHVLNIEVRDEDHFVDDILGDCSVTINDLRDGKRHDMWLFLENVKNGRLHLAVTVSARTAKRTVTDEFEPIDIEGRQDTGIWIHHPRREVLPVWEPRKGKSRHLQIHHLDSRQLQSAGGDPIGSPPLTFGQNGSSSADESVDANKPQSKNPIRKGLRKVRLVFHRGTRTKDKSNCPAEPELSPPVNFSALNNEDIDAKFILEDTIAAPYSAKRPKDDEKENGKSLMYDLPQKESGQSKAECRPTPSDNDAALLYDSSNDSFPPSATDVPLEVTEFIVPGSVISKDDINQTEEAFSGTSSFKFKEDIFRIQNELQ
ncbi:unnamed protein product [Fraxinus pennsylvanica]|uniref:C2 domain-containing protein n=1 Tax=Fraxinus pennsylvanica TaxID=56036 RepID=A0AAD2DHP9_9LAMI|nr:unnamed protein product [Fraxinus pennsylvanica]